MKTFSLILVVLFSILAYEKLPNIDTVFFIYSLLLGFSAWMLYQEKNSEKVVRSFAEQLRIYKSYPGYNHVLKCMGEIDYEEQFFSLETDTLLRTVKILGLTDNFSLVDLSKYVGLKRKTVVFDDFKAPEQDWAHGSDKEYLIYFVVENYQKRKLQDYDKITKTSRYSYGKEHSVIKVFTKD